jgi:hypothetical protein
MPPTPSPTTPAPALVPPYAGPDVTTDNRFRMLEARLGKDEQIEKEQAESIAWLRKFKLSGFVQPQLLIQSFNDSASPNALSNGTLPPGISANDIITNADGTTTNGTFFRVRRARLKTEFMPSEWSRFVLEIDPAPIGGPGVAPQTIARQIEAVGIVKWTADFTAEYALGIFRLPFGFEVPENDADRIFIERTWAAQNMFPGEYDTGARASGWMLKKKLQGTFAVVNGITQGERSFTLIPDLNRGKDVLARVTYDLGPITPGVSAYYGQGQHIDVANLRFKQFPRWAVDAELTGRRTILKNVGETRIAAELVLGHDMDRGVKYGFALPAIPSPVSNDVDDKDELGAYVRVEQDVSKWFTFGARYDYYSPDTAQSDNGRHTLGFVAAANCTTGLRLAVEYDHAIDDIHAPLAPTIPTKQTETFSTVLQARF